MELKIKEFAARERVNERTVRRWIARGAIEARRTPGGGVRIAVEPVEPTSASTAPSLLVMSAPRGVEN